MRWPLWRNRSTQPVSAHAPAGADSPTPVSATASPPATTTGPATQPARATAGAWVTAPPLRTLSALVAPTVGPAPMTLPQVAGTRSLLPSPHVDRSAAPVGRADLLATVLPAAEDPTRSATPPGASRTPSTETGVDHPGTDADPQPRGSRPLRWVATHDRTPAQAAPLTKAVESYVGDAREPAEPYRAPGWLRAAATQAHLFTPEPAPSRETEDVELPPLDFSGHGLIASWQAPEPPAPEQTEEPERPLPTLPAVERGRPAARRRSLGESRRLGLGAPISQTPGQRSDLPPLRHGTASDTAPTDAAPTDAAPTDSTPTDTADTDDSSDGGGSDLATHPPPPGSAPAPDADPGPRTLPALPLPLPESHAGDSNLPPLLHPASAQPGERPQGPAVGAEPQPAAQALYRPAPQEAPQPAPTTAQVLAAIPLAAPPPPDVERVPPTVAAAFKAAYGADVSRVPVHRGPQASTEARLLHTRAFSRGGAVYLPSAEGPLDSPGARAVLNHELMHVVQQRTLGSALPEEHTVHGRALEAEARQAETLAVGATAPAELTHPPAAASTDRQVQQVIDELVRQGIAHRDGAGNVLIGTDFELPDLSATVAQRLGTEEKLQEIKLKAIAEARGISEITTLDDPKLSENDRRDIAYEVQQWLKADTSDLTNTTWLENTKLAAVQARWTDGGGDAEKMPSTFPALEGQTKLALEIEKEKALLRDLAEKEGASTDDLPRIPKVIGKWKIEALVELEKLAKKAEKFWKERGGYEGLTIKVSYQPSLLEKGRVLYIEPPTDEIVMQDTTEVEVVVSEGKDEKGAITGDLLLGAAETFMGMFGLKIDDRDRKRFREMGGARRSEATVHTPLTGSQDDDGDDEEQESKGKEGRGEKGEKKESEKKESEKKTPVPAPTTAKTSQTATGTPPAASKVPTGGATPGGGTTPAVVVPLPLPLPEPTTTAQPVPGAEPGPVRPPEAAAGTPGTSVTTSPGGNPPATPGAGGVSPATPGAGVSLPTTVGAVETPPPSAAITTAAAIGAATVMASVPPPPEVTKTPVVGTKPSTGSGRKPEKKPEKELKPLEMPAVIGKKQIEAEKALRDKKIKYAVLLQDSFRPAGEVIFASPDAGSRLDTDENVGKQSSEIPVEIIVSAGIRGELEGGEAGLSMAAFGRAAKAELALGAAETFRGIFGRKVNDKWRAEHGGEQRAGAAIFEPVADEEPEPEDDFGAGPEGDLAQEPEEIAATGGLPPAVSSAAASTLPPAVSGSAAASTLLAAVTGAGVTLGGQAAATVAAPDPGSPDNKTSTGGRASLDDLDLNEVADRLYPRIRSRLARELRIDRARQGIFSDFR